MRSLNSITFVLSLTLSIKLCGGKFVESSVLDVNEEDEVIFRKYIEFDKHLKKFANYGLKWALPMIMEASGKLNLSAKCMGNVLQLGTGMSKLKLSAMKFLDASGKPPSAFLNGNMNMLGDYDQCLSAEMESRKGTIAFRGQYCLVHYTPLLPPKKRPITLDGGVEELVEATKNTSEVVRYIISKVHFFYYYPAKYGMCVPSGCTEDDISQIVAYTSEKISLNASLVYCDSDSDVFLSERNITFLSLFVLMSSVILMGTFVDYYSWKNIRILTSFMPKLLRCFSILSNFPKAISTEQSENHISCLHGIRGLTVLYIILLHQYYAISKFYITSHTLNALEDIPQFAFQIIANGFLAADVFFFLGGLLNCYTRVKMERNKRRNTNLFFIVFHRLVRIAPAYVFFCFLMSLFKPIGPMRVFEQKQYIDKCLKNWWQNMLFINNFFEQDDTCAPHTWYIALDMQLFVVSLVTVPLFFNRPKKGFVVNSVVVFLGILSTVIWSWVNKLTPGVVLYRPNAEEINVAWNAHTFTLPHVAPYFTGILMGYYLAVIDVKHVKMSKMYQVIGWPVASILFLSMLFMTKVWNSGGAFTVVDSSFYFGFSKFLFVVAISWVVLCCSTGNGGIVNYILSLPLWVPISRISYVVYLIGPFIQTFYFTNTKTVLDGHKMPLIWRYAGDTLISLLLGFAIYTLIEAPFKEIEKLLFYRQPTLREEIVKPEDIIVNGIGEEKKNNKDELELNHNKINIPS